MKNFTITTEEYSNLLTKMEETFEIWGGIQNYRFSPNKWYYRGDAKHFLGLEVEVECGSRREEVAKSYFDKYKRFYTIHDGSLTDENRNVGFEFVFAPTEYSLLCQDVQQVFSETPDIYVTPRCAVHLHHSKRYLNRITLYFIFKFLTHIPNLSFVFSIARRLPNGKYCRLMERTYQEFVNNKRQYIRTKESNPNGSFDKYEVLNLSSRHTIEFRMFAGSINPDIICMNIEFVRSLVDYSEIMFQYESDIIKGGRIFSYRNYLEWLYKDDRFNTLKLYINENFES